MFSSLFPPPQKPPTSRNATPRGPLYGRLRMRSRALYPDGLLEIVGVCAGMTQDLLHLKVRHDIVNPKLRTWREAWSDVVGSSFPLNGSVSEMASLKC